MSSRARERLIEIQRKLVAAAKSEIHEALGPMTPELRTYFEEYQAMFPGDAKPVTTDQVARAVAEADVVHFGDYHTLRESQKAPIRILREVIATGRRIILATEVVQLDRQEHVDAYLAGKLDDSAFLRAIDYENTWGFSWRNYRMHFEFARQHGLQVLAVNSDPAVGRDDLGFRDAMAAMLVVEARERDPEALVAVLFGDWHVAPPHIPARVEVLVHRRKLPPVRQVVVFQNAEKVYWWLAERELEQKTHAVQIAEDIYCLMNSTPLVKYQSYLNWEMNQDELEESIGFEEPEISSSVMTEQVHEIVRTICRFLEIRDEGFDDFTVHTSRDLDFLDQLEESGGIEAEDLAEFREQVERDESFFLVDGRLIYLGNLSLDHAAEEATHYINTKLAGHVRRPTNRVFDFYYRTLKEAIGFLGSKIIDQKRACYHRPEFEQVLDDTRGKRLGKRMQQIREVGRDVLTHLDFEARRLAGEVRGYPRFRSLYERDLPVHIGTTHSLGYILGDRIYAALMDDKVRGAEVRLLFEEQFEASERPRELYFNWMDYLE